jgi:hypothetical protein
MNSDLTTMYIMLRLFEALPAMFGGEIEGHRSTPSTANDTAMHTREVLTCNYLLPTIT